ncbi:hypothetical protein [Nocardia transvalensis]|uniref:hypothetical protein n=1 Tax=Nocardia transvalensis TaxID=37333 RepID=UPI0018947F0C|nr:hypothetical protein [Nocardia transvalensis]MBF6327566.1 hypothetical protein [Nocardia transvalensis]
MVIWALARHRIAERVGTLPGGIPDFYMRTAAARRPVASFLDCNPNNTVLIGVLDRAVLGFRSSPPFTLRIFFELTSFGGPAAEQLIQRSRRAPSDIADLLAQPLEQVVDCFSGSGQGILRLLPETRDLGGLADSPGEDGVFDPFGSAADCVDRLGSRDRAGPEADE